MDNILVGVVSLVGGMFGMMLSFYVPLMLTFMQWVIFNDGECLNNVECNPRNC